MNNLFKQKIESRLIIVVIKFVSGQGGTKHPDRIPEKGVFAYG